MNKIPSALKNAFVALIKFILMMCIVWVCVYWINDGAVSSGRGIFLMLTSLAGFAYVVDSNFRRGIDYRLDSLWRGLNLGFHRTKNMPIRIYKLLKNLPLRKPTADNPELNVLLISAVKARKFSAVQDLIKKGANINCQSSLGSTLLMASVKNNDLNFCKFLIESGADIHIRNNEGKTAADLAEELRNEEILIYLLSLAEKLNKSKSESFIIKFFKPLVIVLLITSIVGLFIINNNIEAYSRIKRNSYVDRYNY